MYLQKILIENIRSISHFEMEFPEPAGWHVIIGDNGSGKTSVVQAISLSLIGNELGVLRQPLEVWLNHSSKMGSVHLDIFRDETWDGEEESLDFFKKLFSQITIFKADNLKINSDFEEKDLGDGVVLGYHVGAGGKEQYKKWGNKGWFSAGYGPFRRFSGGNSEQEKVFKTNPMVGAHLSIFGEDVALTEALEWIRELDYQRLKEKELNGQNGKRDSTIVFENLIRFINESDLLPHRVRIEGVDEKRTIIFKDGNGTRIAMSELSDGYRSVLSLTFDLIRQLVRVYGAASVFNKIVAGKMHIPVPGVVLIDEIDAHLHPTWQVRIGHWLTKYFPNIQFIVTTHSPLICRACDKGSIWRLAAPGSSQPSGEITSSDKDKLIFGNILDAYGTEVFGTGVVRGEKSEEKMERLGHLNMLFALGKIKPAEDTERFELQKILTTDAPTGLKRPFRSRICPLGATPKQNRFSGDFC